ncbi:uncharacterized protein ppp1r3ab [Myxocyprinus asiaticus]|uniref:uncharacterized protein ppp1r3ab n=1 Tax=Myxocyprinus asiaticus TaxID=70543 RepID=UPI002222045A|nr:uncharacterized protein ppp1r3ab [Myxocyprinus asiaticus]
MESVGALGSSTGASSNLLSLPAPFPWDEDEELLGLGGIKPSSSPIPRRRSSVSSDDSQPPPSSSRKVSFADAFGLSLVSVKQFDAWAANAPSGPLERDLSEVKEYYMFLLCTLPQTVEELVLRTHEQKLELESLELLPGTTTLRGIIRVLNLCFDKMVYVRTSLDSWRSHFDLLAEYVPGSSNGETDCFSFKLTLVPPFGEDGSRVDFCLRYETSLGTFWANNNEKNYAFFFYEKAKEKPCEPCNSENKRKGCLKTTSSNVTALADATTNNEEFPDINTNSGKPTNTPSQNANSEKIQKDSKELEEDMSRIRDRRNRRKAARLAKVKEQFAKREEEKKQGTKAKESELKEETNVQEHASMLVKTPWSPLSQQTTGGPLTCNQTSLSPAECLKFAEHSGDSIDAFSRQVQAQPEKDTIIHFETNLSRAHANSTLEGTCCDKFIACSASEVLDDIQNIENLCDQTVSINQHVPGCQNSDLAISKNFKRAWENFEQDFRSLAQSSKIDEDSNISDGKAEQRENLTLKTSNSENQLFSHGLTFGTIVAPLYHQVFKKMESERKDFIHRAFQVNPSFRELEDESQRAVMPPESYYAPMRHTAEICPEPVHNVTVDVCNESTAQNLINKVKPIKNPLFESNEGKLEKTDDSTSGIRECPIEITITETNLHPKATSKQPDFSLDTLALTELSLQVDSHHSPCLIPLIETDPYDAIHKTMDSGIHSLSEQAPPSPPTMILKPLLSLENQSFATKIEVLQNQENSTNTQTHTKWEDITLQTQMPNAINNNLPLNKSNQILEESHNPISENITFVVPQNQTDLNPSLTKTQPHITSTPNQSPEVTPSLNPISGKSVETPNFSATSTVHTKHSNSTSFSLPQSPEDPQMRQTSAIILDSSDEKLEPVCCEMKMNNEKLEKCSHLGFETEPYTESENSQKIMSNALESCQMNEKKQMLMDFSTLTPETDRSSITDDTNDFDGKHDDTSVIKVMDEIDNIRKGELCQVSEGLEVQKEHKIMQTEKQGQEEENYEDEEEEQEEDTEAEVKEEINNTEDEIKYIDDEEDMDMDKMGAEREQNHQINAVDQQSLETEFEEQKLVIKTSNFELLPPICIDLDENEGQQCTGESQGDGEFSEREDSHHKSGVETYEDMGAAWQASTQNSVTALSRGIQAKKNDWDLLEFIDKEDDLCCESKKLQHEQESTDDVNNMLVDMECEPKDSMNRDIEADVEDNASTESLIDDEMELYLHSLRNSQQSVFREGMMNGSYCKRPSVSRGRSMSLAMPAISESVDEDQLNSSLEDVTNIEDIMELERATLPLVDGNEHVIGRNVLWWKEFLSYDNMSRVIGYTFLLIVFLVTAFYYDFIACFALYLLTVYWLFCQGEGEPLKSSRRAEKGPQ